MRHREPRFCPFCGVPLEWRPVTPAGERRPACPQCNYVYWWQPKVAAGTIPVLDGKVVLVRRGIEPSYGLWVFPGGYVGQGETLVAAAIRETREEARVDVTIERLIDVYSYPDSDVVVAVYEARVVGGRPEAGDECLELALFTPDRIPWDELAFPSTRDALRDWLRLRQV
ncbi:MAG TPA: NUDIX hydrolase [Thermaerobacter sp.]